MTTLPIAQALGLPAKWLLVRIAYMCINAAEALTRAAKRL